MKWKTIIFDMDGTLYDTEEIAKHAWYAIEKHFNLPVSDEFIVSLCGRTRESAQEIFWNQFHGNWNEEEVYRFRAQFMVEYKKEHGPLPKCDLNALFTALKKKGYRLAICSSSSREEILYNLSFDQLAGYFDVIVDGSMTKHGKPAPDIYLKTAELLNEDPKDCLVIEDSISGCLSGLNAGMDAVMVIDLLPPTEELKERCYRILDSLEQLLDLV